MGVVVGDICFLLKTILVLLDLPGINGSAILLSAIFDGIHPVITLQLVGPSNIGVGLGVLYFLMSVTTVVGTPIAGRFRRIRVSIIYEHTKSCFALFRDTCEHTTLALKWPPDIK